VSAFPFSALVGQEPLREALLVCAVDPAISGVLVRGERGTAKTTAVRGLAPVLDGKLVELPIGATADRVLGTLDLDRALGEGKATFQPGLLANAHEGLLYVDEVNLLPDHLVDVLLDAAALGRVHIERDGISTSYDARFLLVGTMNPEEGDLRPQLLDRFGLSVEVVGSSDPEVRVEIVRRRLAQKMEFLTDDIAASVGPEDAAVREFFEKNAGRYAKGGRVSFRQVFFSVAKRGAGTEAEIGRASC
jgi:magnesium chelatase subunit D